MNTRTIRALAALACTAMALAACNGSESSTQTAPIPTNASDVTTEAPGNTGLSTTTETVEATTVSTTTEADTTTSAPPETTTPPTTNVLESFGIPPAALETDPASPNNNRIIKPEDEPIIAAYLEATGAQNTVFSKWPLDATNPAILDGPFTQRVIDGFEQAAAQRTELNQVLDISGGITPRPYVIEDDDGDPDRAIVWDCQVDATFWKDVSTGTKSPPVAGDENVGPPGAEIGTSTALVNVNGRWLVDEGGFEARSCS